MSCRFRELEADGSLLCVCLRLFLYGSSPPLAELNGLKSEAAAYLALRPHHLLRLNWYGNLCNSICLGRPGGKQLKSSEVLFFIFEVPSLESNTQKRSQNLMRIGFSPENGIRGLTDTS